MGSSLACTFCVVPNFGMILNARGRVDQFVGAPTSIGTEQDHET